MRGCCIRTFMLSPKRSLNYLLYMCAYLFLSFWMALYAFDDVQKTSLPVATTVGEGAPFYVEKPVSLQEAAYPALKLYLETLLMSRPLPWPYYIEKFDVQKGMILLQGRVLSHGSFVIPLGVLWWNGQPYMLPSIRGTSIPIHDSRLTAANMLLPFPGEAVFISAPNIQLENGIMRENQEKGLLMVLRLEKCRRLCIVVSLFLICIPAVIQLLRWRRLQKPLQSTASRITPAAALVEVKQLWSEGEKPWDKLVYVLNLAASPGAPSLTSYELAKQFAVSGNKELAEASAMIEKYGYRPACDQYFDQTMALVENGLTAASASPKNCLKNFTR